MPIAWFEFWWFDDMERKEKKVWLDDEEGMELN